MKLKGFTRTDSLEVHMRLHENKAPVLPTIETLDNIHEHYIEVDDYSGKSESEHSDIDGFSDHDDGLDHVDDDNDDDNRDCFEPQVDIHENTEEPIKTEPNAEETLAEEATPVTEEKNSDIENFDDDNEVEKDNDSDSAHSEYLPNRHTKPKGM